MASSNVDINVSANTSSAVGSLQRLSNTMSNINNSIERTAKKMYNFGHTIQEFGQNVYSIGQRATIGISAPLAGVGKKIVQTGAEMKAMRNTFKIVFGKTEKDARAWSKKLSSSVGLSSGIIDKTNLNFRKMAGAFGLTGKEALDFSSKWTKLTLDVAAFNDIPIEDATQRMMSGLRGEADAVEKLGIFMGEANLKAQMLSMGIDGQYSKLSQTKKMQVLYALATKQTAQATGQAKREADSYQNSMANMKQALAEVSEKIFVVLEPAVLDTVKSLTKFVDKLKELTPEQIKFYANIAKWAVILPPVIMYIGATVEALGRLVKVFGYLIRNNPVVMFLKLKDILETIYLYGLYVLDFFGKIGAWVSQAGSSIAGAFTAVAGALGISVGWLIAIVVGIAVAVYLIIKYWDDIKAWTIATWDKIVSYLSEAWNKIVDVLNEAIEKVKPILNDISNAFTEVFTKYIIPAYETYIKPVIDFFVMLGQGIWKVISVIAKFIGLVFGTIITLAVGFSKIVYTAIKFVVDIFRVLWQVIVFVANVIGVILAGVGTVFTVIFGGIAIVIRAVAKVIWWLLTGVIAPVFKLVWTIIKGIADFFFKILWGTVKFVINGIGDILTGLGDIFMWVYDNAIKPILGYIRKGIDYLDDVFGTSIGDMIDSWSTFGDGIVEGYNKHVKPFFDFIVDGLKDLNGNWEDIWKGIKKTFLDVVEGLKEAWNSIKNAWKLPHLKVTGKFSILPPKVPSFGVDWYAKGGLFSSASVIGVGEAGDEAVLPLTNNKTMSMLGSAIAHFMPDKKQDTGKVLDKNVVINVNGLVVREEADVERIGQQLYRLQQRELRRSGRSDF